ncbi:MAG: NADH-quinone oxidoreductase subunit J [Deltaproteobacteria bacterium]|nr:NADH-quinone oxidoreductase subunit J [Deltaproteobacteria bacterium]
MEPILFAVLAAVALVAAVATIAWRNPLRSAFSLIVCLFALAGMFVTLFAHFLAAMQILVYAGAIMVLFVFVIMLLDLSGHGSELKLRILPVLGSLAVLAVAGKFAKTVLSTHPLVTDVPPAVPDSFGTVPGVAELLLGQFLLPFELVSLLLLVAVVGAVVVARRRFWREGK